MAIANVTTLGIGANDGVAGFVITLGFGSLTAAAAVAAPAAAGKYRPEHAGALRDLAAATGFAAEHRSALSDLRDAGV